MAKKYTEKDLKSKNRAQLVELAESNNVELGEHLSNDDIRKLLLEVEEASAEEEPADVHSNSLIADVIRSRRMTAKRGIKTESNIASAIASRRAKAGSKTGTSVIDAIASRKAEARSKGVL